MDEDLGPDVPAAERRTLFAAQHPFAAASTGQAVTTAAWETKPSWYLVADDDRMVSPELQRAMAHKIGATTQSLAAGHLPMLSQPARVAAFIMEAAQQLEG